MERLDEKLHGEDNKGLRLLVDSLTGGIAQLIYDRENGLYLQYANEGFWKISYYTQDELDSLFGGQYNRIILEEDWDKLRQTLEAAVKSRQDFSAEYRVLGKGGVYWRQMKGMAVFEDDKIVIKSIITDITEFKTTQDKLVQEKERFQAMAALSADLLFEYTIDTDQMVYASQREDDDEHSMVIEHYRDTILEWGYIHEEDIPKFLHFYNSLRGNQEYMTCELRSRFFDGTHRWVQIKGKRIYDTYGNPTQVVGRIVDIHEQKTKEQELLVQITKDPLTGLLNKKIASQQIQEYLSTERTDNSVLAIMDIDHFKDLNIRIGHLFGDIVLAKTAEGLLEVIGEQDIAGRFNSDEFIMLLKEVHTEEDAREQINRMLQMFHELHFHASEREVTCSIGVTMINPEDKSMEDVYVRADRALYFAKHNTDRHYEIFSREREDSYIWENSDSKLYTGDQIMPYRSENLTEEIAEFAFELVEGMENMSQAISVIFNRVAQKYNLNAIGFFKVKNNRRALQLLYGWQNQKLLVEEGEFFRFTNEVFSAFKDDFDQNGVRRREDTARLGERFPAAKVLSELGIQSSLEYGYFHEKDLRYVLCFFDSMGTRQWGMDEVRVIRMLSRVLTSQTITREALEHMKKHVYMLESYDELTGLLKYDAFREKCEQFLKEDKSGQRYAMVYSDFSNFKYINDNFGYGTGDKILKEFADLVAHKNAYCIYGCRDCSDHFLTLVKVTNKDTLSDFVAKINKQFAENQNNRYTGGNLEIYTGGYILEGNRMDINVVIDNANLARKLMKMRKTPGFAMFDENVRNKMLGRDLFADKFHKAMENDEFQVYMQPKIALSNERIVGAEALVRWQESSGKMIFPDEFIPLLEANGDIVELDFLVFEKVVQYIRKWKQEKKQDIVVSTNFSRRHVSNKNLAEKLESIVRKYDVEPECIEVEITESAFIDNQHGLIDLMNQVQKKGFRVSIDDFGSGYSSLKMLTEVPADVVKMDKDFLRSADVYQRSQDVIRHIISLAKAIDMTVLCEGVETKEQADFLKVSGCDLAQGYYYAKPMPIQQFEKLW